MPDAAAFTARRERCAEYFGRRCGMPVKIILRAASMFGVMLLAGCGQAVLAHKLNALNARFEQRLQITPGVLPPLSVGQTYSGQLGATGGIAPYHWKIVQGDLPPGLSLEASNGTISGVPERTT